ncbi:metallophosphoesterase [Natronosalvus halobius]|uniref:metallophosphoesterase n=1 Tax=Natronosalvus halobius TaxID=2953746 RepID=UPI0020A084DB|nr:metallophosphoesterase [Natronosalvus halobius]USZ73398.1 metallophosphoesterase [Natronosalvus halobius]
MLAIFSDTHSTGGHHLEGAALEAAREADAVVHAGDFTTVETLEAFRSLCPVFYPVHGNADNVTVTEQLPPVRIVDCEGIRIAVTHRRDGGDVGLAMFGRSREADVVVSGHTHRPSVVDAEGVLLLNPGSHAQPRGNRPGFATLERGKDGTVRGELREPDGTLLESFALERENRSE